MNILFSVFRLGYPKKKSNSINNIEEQEEQEQQEQQQHEQEQQEQEQHEQEQQEQEQQEQEQKKEKEKSYTSEIIPMNNSTKRDENSVVYKSFTKFVSMRWDNNVINVYENEKKWLKKFKDTKHLPKMLYYDDIAKCIVTQYCGEEITIHNIPLNIMEQIEELLNELSNLNCSHNDIKPEELLIYNNTLYLVDFGWGYEKDKEIPNEWPPCLGGRFRTPHNCIISDTFSIYNSLHFILCKISNQIKDKSNKKINLITNELNNEYTNMYKKNLPDNLDTEQQLKWWKEYISDLSKPSIYYLK